MKVLQRPSRELLERAAAVYPHYELLRMLMRRDDAFEAWCGDAHFTEGEVRQLSYVRVSLLKAMFEGDLTYDGIDWSGQDKDRRASSTGKFVELEEWVDG